MFDFSFNFNPNAIHNITTLKEAMIDNFLAEKQKGTKVYTQELLDYILYINNRWKDNPELFWEDYETYFSDIPIEPPDCR